MTPENPIWVFNGSRANAQVGLPGGIFTDKSLADAWIARHKLTGVLTAYPLNEGCFDWAVANHLVNMRAEKLNNQGDGTLYDRTEFHYDRTAIAFAVRRGRRFTRVAMQKDRKQFVYAAACGVCR